MKRTPKEIRRWFRSNLWYREFLHHAWFGRTSLKTAIAVISGRYGIDTLTAAFTWDNTLQGYGIWSVRNNDFKTWYKYGTK